MATLRSPRTENNENGYRIIDLDTNSIVAQCPSLTLARETLELLKLDYPTTRFELQEYTIR
jgi:hypothetical protein